MSVQPVAIDDRITGAAMDLPVPHRARRRIVAATGVVMLVVSGIATLWSWMPRGLQVKAADMRIAAVERGMFRDDMAVRATAAPLSSVMLDSVESGRVEEVFAKDGAPVKKGELLFRLSNPQRNLELLARESDRAQQITNLFNLRAALEAGEAEHGRRMSGLDFALSQVRKQHARNEALAQKGFISTAALDESADRLAQQRHAFEDEKRYGERETAIKRDAVARMEQAIGRLDAGLKLVNATIEALTVRAPVEGRLTDFHLQVGETVKTDQHIGRIDDPSRFKLSAQVDEYYLSRVAVGRQGSVLVDGQEHAVEVSRIYPQVKEGRFTIELTFSTTQPSALNPGRNVEAHVTLGEATQGLLLPNDAFINDTGGTWVFVTDREGTRAERRAVRTGRRNNSQIEILSGLTAGERVIVSSYNAYGKAERLQIHQ